MLPAVALNCNQADSHCWSSLPLTHASLSGETNYRQAEISARKLRLLLQRNHLAAHMIRAIKFSDLRPFLCSAYLIASKRHLFIIFLEFKLKIFNASRKASR